MIFQERGKIRLQMIKKNTGATTENKFVAKRNHMGTHAFCENVVVFSFQKKRKKKKKKGEDDGRMLYDYACRYEPGRVDSSSSLHGWI